jgi:hypothetical protein
MPKKKPVARVREGGVRSLSFSGILGLRLAANPLDVSDLTASAGLFLLMGPLVICPTGCPAIFVSSPFSQNFSLSRLVETGIERIIPPQTEGRFAIVTDVGRGMRWTRAALLTRARACGRRSRVVLTPRRWRQVGEDNR